MVPLTVPDIEAPTGLLADWLELRALFSVNGRAPFRELGGQEDLEWDQDALDVDEEDARLEDLANSVAAEIAMRQKALDIAYPYSVSDGAEELRLAPQATWTVGHATYLFSLILAHATKSEILSGEVVPTGEALVVARELFQICGTFAAAGHITGPSFCFGFPRP